MTVAALCAALPTIKSHLKGDFLSITNRPAVGEDFGELKIVYADLFEHNSRAFKIAGRPEFPLDTDSAYPASSASIKELTEKIKLESLLNIAYSRSEKPRPTRTVNLSLKTNRWQNILADKKEIAKITIKSAPGTSLTGVGIELVKQIPSQPTDANLIAKAVRLFNYFLSIKNNGTSPLGEEFNIPFDKFSRIYGYGQCSNQSYALADLFEKNAIPARLVKLSNPAHTVVEAKVSDEKWAVFDPLLGSAFADAEKNIVLDFDEVQENPDAALKQFVAEENYEKSKYYYEKNTAVIIPFVEEAQTDENFSFSLNEDQFIEYDFDEHLPWLTKRNITVPDETVGFIKLFKGAGTDFQISSPYAVVSVVAQFLNSDTKIKVDGSEVPYDPSWEFTRLVRYVWFRSTAKIETSKPVNLTIVSQFSILPYHRFTDGLLRVNAREKETARITVEYFAD